MHEFSLKSLTERQLRSVIGASQFLLNSPHHWNTNETKRK